MESKKLPTSQPKIKEMKENPQDQRLLDTLDEERHFSSRLMSIIVKERNTITRLYHMLSKKSTENLSMPPDASQEYENHVCPRCRTTLEFHE